MLTVKRRVSPDELLTLEQIATLLDVKGDDVFAVRDKALLQLAYSAGIRLAELVSLNIDDIALERSDAFVQVRNGRGRKERFVRIGSNAVNAIQSWLAVRYQLARAGERALFVSRLGTRPSNRTVQALIKKRGQESLGIRPVASSIRSMVKKRGEESIGVHVHPHMLRRAYATHFIAGGGGAFALRDFMGHSFIATTERYVAMDNAARSGIYHKAFSQG